MRGPSLSTTKWKAVAQRSERVKGSWAVKAIEHKLLVATPPVSGLAVESRREAGRWLAPRKVNIWPLLPIFHRRRRYSEATLEFLGRPRDRLTVSLTWCGRHRIDIGRLQSQFAASTRAASRLPSTQTVTEVSRFALLSIAQLLGQRT